MAAFLFVSVAHTPAALAYRTATGPRGGQAAVGPRGGGYAVGPNGGAAARGPYGRSAAVRGPEGSAAVRGPYGGAAARGPYGGAAARGPYGGAAARGPYGNTAVRGPNGVYAGSRTSSSYYRGGHTYVAPGWGANRFYGYGRGFAGYPGWRYYGSPGLVPALAPFAGLAFLSAGVLLGTYAQSDRTVYVYMVKEGGIDKEVRVDSAGNVLSEKVVAPPQ